MLKEQNILIISPELWGMNFVSKHHYAKLAAQSGSKVYFLEPPILSDQKKIESHKSVVDHLYIIRYPKPPRGINKLPAKIRRWLYAKIAKNILDTIGCSIDLVWSFDPYVFQDLSVFGKAVFKLYHPVDVHHTNLEFECIAKADLVLSTASLILEKFDYDKDLGLSRKYAVPMKVINHGLASHFLERGNIVKLPSGTGNIKVGYVGNLNYPYLDYETLFTIIERNSNIDFYFIGPFEQNNLSTNTKFEKEITKLKSYSNTYLLGPKPSEGLPSLLLNFDMFLMTYKSDNRPVCLANPHKILEYLSTGKVVVSHYIDEYADKMGLIEMISDNNDLPELFAKVCSNLNYYNEAEKQNKRKSFALANTYEKQYAKILDLVNSKYVLG